MYSSICLINEVLKRGWWDPMYVGMDKRLFRLGEIVYVAYSEAHIR